MSCSEKDITIEYTAHFKREFKRLSKKYRSLIYDFRDLKLSLKQAPLQGIDLGNRLRKLRLAITSKGKGKSGGARVITHVLLSIEGGTVTFLSIYDKSERSNISDSELKTLMIESGLI